MKPTNNYSNLVITLITLQLLVPTIRAIDVHGSASIDGGREERPPLSETRRGGHPTHVVRSPVVTIARHAQARPPPLVPVWVPTTDAAALLFLPPVLSLIHPALYLIFVFLTPARNSARLLAAPPSLSSPWRQQRLRPAQRRSHKGTVAGGRQAAGYPVRVVVVPATQGGGGGRRTQRPVAPGIAQPISQTVVSLSSSSLLGAQQGGGTRGGGVFGWWRRLTGREWIFLLKCQKIQRMEIGTELDKFA